MKKLMFSLLALMLIAGVTQAQGIGFAVPTTLVKEFLEAICRGKGKLEKAR